MNENPDKPENIIEKMIVGRLNKELKRSMSVEIRLMLKLKTGKTGSWKNT